MSEALDKERQAAREHLGPGCASVVEARVNTILDEGEAGRDPQACFECGTRLDAAKVCPRCNPSPPAGKEGIDPETILHNLRYAAARGDKTVTTPIDRALQVANALRSANSRIEAAERERDELRKCVNGPNSVLSMLSKDRDEKLVRAEQAKAEVSRLRTAIEGAIPMFAQECSDHDIVVHLTAALEGGPTRSAGSHDPVGTAVPGRGNNTVEEADSRKDENEGGSPVRAPSAEITPVSNPAPDAVAASANSQAADLTLDGLHGMLRRKFPYLSNPEARGILSAVLPSVLGAVEGALKDAIDGWEDGAAYKGDYLRGKHGDDQGVAEARATHARIKALLVEVER